MINAKEEILDHIRGKDVEFLRVAYIERYGEKGLRIDGELNDCVKLLDFYTMMVLAVKKLFGFILYKDGSWSEREEYDGSEWWVHRKPPTINTELDILGDL